MYWSFAAEVCRPVFLCTVLLKFGNAAENVGSTVGRIGVLSGELTGVDWMEDNDEGVPIFVDPAFPEQLEIEESKKQ